MGSFDLWNDRGSQDHQESEGTGRQILYGTIVRIQRVGLKTLRRCSTTDLFRPVNVVLRMAAKYSQGWTWPTVPPGNLPSLDHVISEEIHGHLEPQDAGELFQADHLASLSQVRRRIELEPTTCADEKPFCKAIFASGALHWWDLQLVDHLPPCVFLLPPWVELFQVETRIRSFQGLRGAHGGIGCVELWFASNKSDSGVVQIPLFPLGDKFIHDSIHRLRFPEASGLLDGELSAKSLVVLLKPFCPGLGIRCLPQIFIVFERLRVPPGGDSIWTFPILFALGLHHVVLDSVVAISMVGIEECVLLRVEGVDNAKVWHPVCSQGWTGSGFHQAYSMIDHEFSIQCEANRHILPCSRILLLRLHPGSTWRHVQVSLSSPESPREKSHRDDGVHVITARVVIEDGMPNAFQKQMGHHWLPRMFSACIGSNRKIGIKGPWHFQAQTEDPRPPLGSATWPWRARIFTMR